MFKKSIIIFILFFNLFIINFSAADTISNDNINSKCTIEKKYSELLQCLTDICIEKVNSMKNSDLRVIFQKLEENGNIELYNCSDSELIKIILKNSIIKEKHTLLDKFNKKISNIDNSTLKRIESDYKCMDECFEYSAGEPFKKVKDDDSIMEKIILFDTNKDDESSNTLFRFLAFSDVLYKNRLNCEIKIDNHKEKKFYEWGDIKKIIYDIEEKHPEIVKIFSLGKTLNGRNIPILKISDNPGIDENEPEILITSGMHPREQQPQVCTISLIKDLVEGYSKDKKIRNLINSREIWIVPVLNVDGKIHDFRRGINKHNNWRKNRRKNPDGSYGVDINRNFPVRWVRNTLNGKKEDFPGSGPASEPETRNLMNFIKNHNLSFYVDIHSYMGAIIVPKYISESEAKIYKKIVHNLLSLQKKPYNYKEPVGNLVPEANPSKGAGLGFVWAYCVQGVHSINLEVRGNGFYQTNSTSHKEYEDNIKKPLLYLIENCKDMKPVTEGNCSLIKFIPNKKITPGSSIILKTEISGNFDFAVLVSNSPMIRVLSEYRRFPSKNGFNLKIMPKCSHDCSLPMTLYVWDSNRRKSVINFSLPIF